MGRKTEKVGKWEMSTVGHGIWQKPENHEKWETNTWGLEKWRNH